MTKKGRKKGKKQGGWETLRNDIKNANRRYGVLKGLLVFRFVMLIQFKSLIILQLTFRG